MTIKFHISIDIYWILNKIGNHEMDTLDVENWPTLVFLAAFANLQAF